MININQELHQNFLDFSYEANSQRAFADARDGLKPGQRACLWEMYDKKYTSNKAHVKSAKISGGVIANWWPHGDVAIYDTFARMSQSWINNIPEVDWHGANGSIQISGEPAASRYTEARLSKSTEDGLLLNINKHSVPMKMNFSEDAEWPEVFPAIYPRLMVNGCQGIGSTIANVWLPHNLGELISMIDNYITSGQLDYSNLAPDFPTGGIIINKNELKSIYETGKGKVVLRAKTEIKGNTIYITEIPYQVYVEPLIDQIKKLVIDDTITDINNIVNKSGKNKLLIEIECEKDPARVLTLLFKNSDLQKSYSANQFALVGKTPELLTLKKYLDIFIKHNITCIDNETKYDLEKAKDRLEIVEGLLKALEDIDNIISLIKASDSSADAERKMISKYNLSARQAKAITDMKLGRLAKLEKVELEQEKAELQDKIVNCEKLLADEAKKKSMFLDRLRSFGKKYSTARKTELQNIEMPKTKEEKEVALIPPEKCVVVMTEGGSIKRIPATSFRTQKRGGKGVKTQDDITEAVIRTNTVDSLMVFTNKGKMYRLIVDSIPVGTNTSKGTPIKLLIEMESGEDVQTIYSIYRDTDAKYVLFVTQNGLVKKTALTEYVGTKKSNGIGAINIKDGDALSVVTLVKEEPLIIVTKNGYMIKFNSTEIGATGRLTSGVKGINLSADDEVVAALPLRNVNDQLAIFTSKGYGKKIAQSEITLQKRAGKGILCHKASDINGYVSAAQLISDEDNILLVGDKNSVCISAQDIPETGRIAIGNMMLKGNKILSVSKV